MIAIDTSAWMAIVLGEAKSDDCIKVFQSETEVLVSAGTVAEASLWPRVAVLPVRWQT